MKEFTLYNYFRSSTSFRVRIAMNLKGIEFDYKPVNLLKGEQHSEWFRKLNPMGGVPALEHRGQVIGQSIAILEYLDEIAPQNRLYPADPVLKARVRQIVEDVNSFLHPLGNLQVLKHLEDRYQFSQDMKMEWVAHWYHIGLRALEKELSQTSSAYCFGEAVTAADVVLVPMLATAARYNVDLSPYATLRKINDNCMKLPAFEKATAANQPDAI